MLMDLVVEVVVVVVVENVFQKEVLVVCSQGFAGSSNPDLEFNWHPLLMTISLVYLYGNGILVYR